MEYKKIEHNVLKLLNHFENKLSIEEVEDIKCDVVNGEYGLGFETLCTQIYEYEMEITKDVYLEFSNVGKMLGIEPKYWLNLKELIKKL